MKKKDFLWSMLSVIMVSLLSIGLQSCSDSDKDEPTPSFSVTGDTNVKLSADGTTVSADITVNAVNTDWSASSNVGWLHVNKSGQSVKVSADKNTSSESRHGVITIAATANPDKYYSTLNVTQDGEKSYVKVNGVESTSLQFEGSFSGKSGVDYKQSVTITSNVTWNASDIPSWLSVSPTNGNGTVTMTLYPISENPSSSSRNATIRLVGNGANNATIEVSQSGGLANVKVTPANTLALYNQIGWELETTGDVDKYQMIMVTEAVYKNKTEKELLADLQMDEAEKVAYNPVFFYTSDSYGNTIRENTTYYICTVAYDKNDNMGEIVKSRVTTPSYVDIDNDAWVNLDGRYNLNYGYFEFTATKEAYCDSYHVLYGNLPSSMANYPVVFYVFQINYYIKNKTKHWFTSQYDMEVTTNYPNTHTFTHYTNTFSTRPIIRICAWGVFKNGSESSDATLLRGDVSASNAPRFVKVQTDDVRRNIVIDRSGMKILNNRVLK